MRSEAELHTYPVAQGIAHGRTVQFLKISQFERRFL
jgi:hypothetical protein